MLIWNIALACTQTKVADVASIPAPAVIVMGERMGTTPDLTRARKIVSKLPGPVLVGLQVVSADMQPKLDAHAEGALPTVMLESELGWTGFPFKPYEKLFDTAPTVALGVDVEPKPRDTPIPLPPGYAALLGDAMAGHTMPVELESGFVQTVAWLDHRIARRAVEAWDGKGHLVIVADRAHVEGGKGISWQVQRLTDAPVHSVLLGDPGSCYADDSYL